MGDNSDEPKSWLDSIFSFFSGSSADQKTTTTQPTSAAPSSKLNAERYRDQIPSQNAGRRLLMQEKEGNKLRKAGKKNDSPNYQVTDEKGNTSGLSRQTLAKSFAECETGPAIQDQLVKTMGFKKGSPIFFGSTDHDSGRPKLVSESPNELLEGIFTGTDNYRFSNTPFQFQQSTSSGTPQRYHSQQNYQIEALVLHTPTFSPFNQK